MKGPRFRFWVWILGPVRLTVEADAAPVEWAQGGPTDEGWAAEGCRWWCQYERGGWWLYRDWWESGRDCDGRLDRSGTDRCPVERLAAHPFEGIGYPTWQRVREEQRDYTAEAAGY